MKARIIPANKKMIAAKDHSHEKKLKVAAYCRVSTDREEQESSYEVQCMHYSKLIMQNPYWEMAGIYADEGITALSTRKREQFKAMISDCEAGKIEMIITKSISRFARNTIDCLNYIRKLKALGIPVIFEEESINTMDSKGELLITILASIAQQESESISRNVQMGVRYHYQEGRICAGHQNILGYERTKEGKLQIVPDEAEIVRRIYRYYLDGYSPSHIGKILKEEQLIDRNGVRRRWNTSSIRYILANEKYMGDMILQKYYTVDFLSKKVSINHGQVQQYYVENSHDAIIPKDIFYQVQGETARRKKRKSEVRYLHGSGLSGRVYCGECGSPYYRKKGRYNENIRFRCATKLKNKYKHIECINISIREDDLMKIVVDAFNKLPVEKERLMHLEKRINWGPIAQADQVLKSLCEKIEKVRMDEHDYDETYNTEETIVQLEEKMFEVSEKRAEFAEKVMQVRNLLERINYLSDNSRERKRRKKHINKECTNAEDFFKCTSVEYPTGEMTEYRDEEVLRFIEKIVVGEKVTIHFKAGIQIIVSRAVKN